MSKRAAYQITEELFKHAFGIPKDQVITGAEFNSKQNTVAVYVKGGDLPEVPEAAECTHVRLSTHSNYVEGATETIQFQIPKHKSLELISVARKIGAKHWKKHDM